MSDRTRSRVGRDAAATLRPTFPCLDAMPDHTCEPDLTAALRVVMMPRDTNQYGTIFGGVILSYIDQAAFIEARRHGNHRWVTASIDRVDFRAPVLVGDVVSLRTCTARRGRRSISVRIIVESERYLTRETILVTEALVSMVSVDACGHPIPFDSPATVGPEAVPGDGAPGGAPDQT